MTTAGIRKIIGAVAILCIGPKAYAQYVDDYSLNDWTLDYEEEVPEKPKHKEYKNMLYMQYGYSPNDYLTAGAPHLHFNEYALGWARSIQIMEEKPYFVEAGINAKFSHSDGDATREYSAFNLLAFRIPVNAVYKFYLSKTRDIALAPFAGINCRAIVLGKEKRGDQQLDIFDGESCLEGWKKVQIGWQAGLKLCFDRMYIGVSYGRDFPDDSKSPRSYETHAHIGVCF